MTVFWFVTIISLLIFAGAFLSYFLLSEDDVETTIVVCVIDAVVCLIIGLIGLSLRHNELADARVKTDLSKTYGIRVTHVSRTDRTLNFILSNASCTANYINIPNRHVLDKSSINCVFYDTTPLTSKDLTTTPTTTGG